MASKKVIKVLNNVFFPRPSRPPFGHVCQIGDPILREHAEEVLEEDIHSPVIQGIISRLTSVMKKYQSYGLAAPQIGIPLRIIAMECSLASSKDIKPAVYAAREMSELPLTVFINPTMKVLNYEKILFPEGCESLRGYSGHVERFRAVQVQGVNPVGKAISHNFNGWLARIAQHEMDHLKGQLYIDKMDIKTFQNDAWHKINVNNGRVKIQFDGT